jgi:hypothetical protein
MRSGLVDPRQQSVVSEIDSEDSLSQEEMEEEEP